MTTYIPGYLSFWGSRMKSYRMSSMSILPQAWRAASALANLAESAELAPVLREALWGDGGTVPRGPCEPSSPLRRTLKHPYVSPLWGRNVLWLAFRTGGAWGGILQARRLLAEGLRSLYTRRLDHGSHGGFQKSRTLFWSPYNKGHSILGSILGCPVFGNSHISIRTCA